jgi:inorganic pyrophosphatase
MRRESILYIGNARKADYPSKGVSMKSASSFDAIPPIDKETGLLNVIIETPKNSHCKNSYDHNLGIFRIKKCLPVGAHFPYDFGYIPGTLGQDGDPLDVLVMSNHKTFVGCLIPVRLIGVLEAEQKEKEEKYIRNDRLIGSMEFSADDPQARTVKDFNQKLLKEIEEFFVYYNSLEGKKFQPLGWHGPKRAEALLQEGLKLKKSKS